MRIALVGSRGIPATYSGFETFYEQLGVRLAARGHQVTVYNRSHHIGSKRREYKGVRIVCLPSIQSKHLDTLTHTALSLLHGLFQGYDIVYVCIVGNAPLCLLPKLTRTPVLINVDGDDADREKWQGFAKKYLRWSERVACKLADCVIADAQAIQKRYRDWYGKETVYIPYGANIWPRDLEHANRNLLERFKLESDRYVLFCSRLTPENRADIAIKAFLMAQLPPDMKLVVVGNAPYVDEYVATVNALCDGKRVIATGYLFGDDYKQISCHARMFVLPSGIDGTRPVLLDQMGFGNAVIVRNTAANMEVVGPAGLTFDGAHEIESLATAMGALNADEALLQRSRRNAVERVRANYSWDAVTDRYESLFAQLKRPAQSAVNRKTE